ncbi:MgtC/SapB family protein [Bacillus badius]|uniref:Mg(2+) transport ATPase protein C n=1 Tax=Bacillus badius TaxID=1455 RepID=A0ABR5AYG9_BACBA|nr:MgtC/SapB family protein [Bacillus badius]KIL75245.1 Mg(2+) transport ATPase protein C [Bacillus badius]KIL79768.1 Mg(2+) transport ATPase protein C [Bacillus badius]KZR60332.1 methyltransferase [Bacillus badius]MED4715147.1 MgtC/SapB family protein [Bacillus badius]
MLIEVSDFIFNLGVATILSMVMGLEREIKKKPIGLKTCVVIGITSCLLTDVSIEAANHFAIPYEKPMDPLRLAAQIVSGIGFLGAGVILRRNNDIISGLTTAAIVWGAGAIGIACGAGFWMEAIISTCLIIISVEIFPIIFKWIGPKSLTEKQLKVRIIVDNDEKMTDVLKQMKHKGMKASKVRIKDVQEGHLQQLDLIILVNEKLYATDVYHELKQITHVTSVEMEAL